MSEVKVKQCDFCQETDMHGFGWSKIGVSSTASAYVNTVIDDELITNDTEDFIAYFDACPSCVTICKKLLERMSARVSIVHKKIIWVHSV